MATEKDISLQYAESVASGAIPSSPEMKSVCEAIAKEFELQDFDDYPYRFDTALADKVERFAGYLQMYEGSFAGDYWKPLPWQRFVLRTVFGWVHKETGYRRYRRVFLNTAKGSGKKLISSCILLYLTFADKEPGAEVYVLAATFAQSQVIFSDAAKLFEASNLFSNKGYVWGGTITPKKIVGKNSSANIITSNSKAPSGPIPSGILVDEAHELPDSRIFDLLRAGTKHRRQPLTFITTNRETGVTGFCVEETKYATAVAKGEAEDFSYLPLLYFCDPDDDPLEDETVWIKANPSLPVIPGMDYLRDEVRRAKQMGGATKSQVLRLNFGMAGQEVSDWLTAMDWEAVEDMQLSHDDGQTKPSISFMGIDLSATTDLTAAYVVHDYGDRLESDGKIWMPKERLNEMQQYDRPTYELMVERNYLYLSGDKTMNYESVVEYILQTSSQFNLRAIAFDSWGIRRLKEILDDWGVRYSETPRTTRSGLLIMPHPQGFTSRHPVDKKTLHLTMPKSISRFEESVLQKTIIVRKNPLLRMAAMGAVPVADGSLNRRFMKKAEAVRIDPIVAMTMAVGLALEHRALQAPSSSGVLVG